MTDDSGRIDEALPGRMHWARWGDPRRAHPLPAMVRELVESFLGPVEERPAVAHVEVRLPPVGLAPDRLAALSRI